MNTENTETTESTVSTEEHRRVALKLKAVQQKLASVHAQYEDAEAEMRVAFTLEQEKWQEALQEAQERLAQLEAKEPPRAKPKAS